mmetsp:Transcript_8389/g.22422  ORF Transcript_8389/g.22422 Transcript_8389/m.22422 type:complete len:312 (-) Transcript_8389:1274-2209(-)
MDQAARQHERPDWHPQGTQQPVCRDAHGGHLRAELPSVLLAPEGGAAPRPLPRIRHEDGELQGTDLRDPLHRHLRREDGPQRAAAVQHQHEAPPGQRLHRDRLVSRTLHYRRDAAVREGRLRRCVPPGRRRYRRRQVRRHQAPHSAGHRVPERPGHELSTALLRAQERLRGHEVQPVSLPSGVRAVGVELLGGLLEGVRRGHAGQDAVCADAEQERRHGVRRHHRGAGLQHGVLQEGLHSRTVDGLGALHAGLWWRHDQARAPRGRAHPGGREVPQPRAPRPAPVAAVQHPGLRRGRDLHRPAGPHHRCRR